MATSQIPAPPGPGTGQGPAPAPDALNRFAWWLAQHSITALRIRLADPAGNLIETLQPAHRRACPAEGS